MKLTNKDLIIMFEHLDNGIKPNDLEKVCSIFASVKNKYQRSSIIDLYNSINEVK
jgi:iron uptake system EfeUOB component EfeO/EfeM